MVKTQRAKSKNMPPMIINHAHIGPNNIRSSVWSGVYPMPHAKAPATPSRMIGKVACRRFPGNLRSKNGNSINAMLIASATRNDTIRIVHPTKADLSRPASGAVDFMLRMEFEPHRIEDRECDGEADAKNPGEIPHPFSLLSID
jgi:hypothetical protein